MPRPEWGNPDRATGRKANLVVALAVLAAVAAFTCAALVLSGPLGSYEFARGTFPTAHDVLIARIQVVVSLVCAASILALLIASAAIKATRTLLVTSILVALSMPTAYFVLQMIVFGIAFRSWDDRL